VTKFTHRRNNYRLTTPRDEVVAIGEDNALQGGIITIIMGCNTSHVTNANKNYLITELQGRES
jgi:hypothetical protein